jgi:serine/threonine protein kinase
VAWRGPSKVRPVTGGRRPAEDAPAARRSEGIMLTPLTDDDPRQIGPYRLHNRIGSGGMGTVYLGFTAQQQAVAVKVASAELAEDTAFRRRFDREVRAAARVRGGAVAGVLDADTDAQQPWMVTEYVEGVSLTDAVRRRGRLEDHLVRGLAVGLADALVAIHAAGVVHRDLKPANILLSWDGPKVIDFGIAQLVDGATLTRDGAVVGTLAWMAPEQMRGEPASAAADVFAWGSCVTFAATGRHPFHADRAELLAYRVQRDIPDLDALPRYLADPVGASLAKLPRERPTAAALLTALVGREVLGVSDAASAAGSVLERTWTGPSPPYGTPGFPEDLELKARGPRGLRPGAPQTASSNPRGGAGWKGPTAPPPPASAFRARPTPATGGSASGSSASGGFASMGSGTADPASPGAASGSPPAAGPAGTSPPARPVAPAAGASGQEGPHGWPARPPGPVGPAPDAPAMARPAAGSPMTAGHASVVRRSWNVPAVLSVILGATWVFGVGSLAAVILGWVGRVQARARGERGAAAAVVGITLGILGVTLTAVAALLVLVIVRR